MATIVAKKVWSGDEQYQDQRPTSITVALLRNGSQYRTATLNADNGWQYSFGDQNSRYQWSVREITQLENYQVTYNSETTGWMNPITTWTLTNTFVPPPEPEYKNLTVFVGFYEDNQDALKMRPVYVDIVLKRDGQEYQTIRLGNGWQWNWLFKNLSTDHEWTVIAQDIPNYVQEVTQEDTDWRFLYRFDYTPPTPPDPSPGNHPTKEDYDLMYSVLYDDISAENAMGIIHVLDYGTFEAPDLP